MKRTPFFIMSVILLLLSGCSGTQSQRQTDDPMPDRKRLLIGVGWPFSTKKDLYRNGIEMALEDINNAGGLIGYRLEAEFRDDKGEVAVGKAIAQQFGENRDIIAVLGHYHSYISLPVSVTYAYYDKLMISPGTTDPTLTGQGFKNVFRTIPSDLHVGAQLAETALALGLKKMVIIDEKSSYGRQLANAIEFRAEEIELGIADRLSYDANIQDYRLMFDKLALSQYDGIFIAGFGADAGAIISTARKKQINVPFFGGNGLDTDLLFEENPKAVKGTMVLSVFHADNPNPYVQHFRKRFIEKYGTEPDAWAAQGYDAVQLLAHAIRDAQFINSADIATSLHNMEPWFGVTGQHRFDQNGNVLGKPMVMKIAGDNHLDFYADHP